MYTTKILYIVYPNKNLNLLKSPYLSKLEPKFNKQHITHCLHIQYIKWIESENFHFLFCNINILI